MQEKIIAAYAVLVSPDTKNPPKIVEVPSVHLGALYISDKYCEVFFVELVDLGQQSISFKKSIHYYRSPIKIDEKVVAVLKEMYGEDSIVYSNMVKKTWKHSITSKSGTFHFVVENGPS